MEVTEEILLPALLAAIVANTVILLLVIVVARRRESVGSAATRSVLQGSLMSTSYIDRSGPSAWNPGDGASGGVGDPEGAQDRDPANALDVASSSAAAAPDPDEVESDSPEAGPESEPGPEPDTEPGPEPETDSALVATSSGTDRLTGLLDPATFTRLVVAEDLRVHRYHRSATIVIFELGGLDRLIARLGPDAADRVVPALADTMRRLARSVDHVARLAPGRFGVLLPETDEVAAINYVERVRRACELWLESGAIALTLAAGWAGTDGDPTLVEAQRLATERMYAELRRDARKAGDR